MRYFLFVFMILTASVCYSVEPHEILHRKDLELRARDISKGLRCPVCQNESIDESSADLSADLRLLVRERLLQGDSNKEVINFIVERYGEFVLLKPRLTGSNLLLWCTGPFLLIIGLFFGIGFIKGWTGRSQKIESVLSEEEKVKLKKILKN